ncbi:TatD family hydrolase [Clostridium polynesiense]|uniref:TatD family hydrolase n=1 Tax=Clostridium polynesiense TaxID=1325933 RepID=UPI00058B5CFB|nr:TatD family hydrolase [Clostridium polynesiense]
MEENNLLIFDSHAHYDDESFQEDRDSLLPYLKSKGIVGILNCGSTLQGTRDSYKLAEKYDFVYAAVGIHPEEAYELNEESLKEIRNMAENFKVKAIGEIGLDYYWEENPPKEVQKDAFKAQMKLAEELDLPVVIHDRDAHGDTLEIIKEFPKVKGVLHCFSGSAEFAMECVKLGYYIGFTGVVTFKNARKVIEAAEAVPIDRILVETDAPYMAPVPYRGKRNQSDFILHIIEKIADIKGRTPEEISGITIENTKRLLNI